MFVATPAMDGSLEVIEYTGSLDKGEADKAKTISYPFSNLKRTLSVHPHFTIYDAGVKLDMIFGNKIQDKLVYEDKFQVNTTTARVIFLTHSIH